MGREGKEKGKTLLEGMEGEKRKCSRKWKKWRKTLIGKDWRGERKERNEV